MSRIPYLRRDDLDQHAAELWDVLLETRGPNLVNGEGGLMGPFNPWLHAPAPGARLAELGRVLRFESSVERRLLEVAIITVGAHWKAEFEWWAHSGMARHHGVSEAVIDALAKGEAPAFEADDELTVHQVARELLTTGNLEDATYEAARDLLGDRGLVELVTLTGYYVLVSFTLNAFRVPLPPGVEPTFG